MIDLGELRLGKMLDRAKNSGEPSRYLRNVNVRWFKFDLSDLLELRATPEETHQLAVQDGDLFICEGGEPGRCAVWRGGRQALVYQKALHRFRSRGAILPELLMYALRASAESGMLATHFTGSTIKHLTGESLARFRVRVPPLPEQKRIVNKLASLLARVDACGERLHKTAAILKRFRQAVLTAAANGELTGEWRSQNPQLVDASNLALAVRGAHVTAGGHKAGNAAPPTEGVHDLTTESFPVGWALLPLRELVQPERPITYGILKPGPELSEGVSYVRVADFPNEQLNLATVRKTSRAMDEAFRRSRLREGDLLLSIRGSVGRLVAVPRELNDANITQDTARLSIQKEVNPTYVLWALRSNLLQERMRRAIKGVAVRGINIGDVRALQIPLPSRSEQDEIVRRVDELMALLDRIAEGVKKASRSTELLGPAVLARAFRGDLVSQDPNDEPASVMLKRIRSERPEKASAEGPKPKRRASVRTKPVAKSKEAPRRKRRAS